MSKRSGGAATAESAAGAICEWRGGTSVLPRGEKGAIHDNRMFTERAFYCIANGAGERPGEGHCGT